MEADKVLESAEQLLNAMKDSCFLLTVAQTDILTEEMRSVRYFLDESHEEMSDACRIAVLTSYAQLSDCWMQYVGKPAVERMSEVDVDKLQRDNDALYFAKDEMIQERKSLSDALSAIVEERHSLRQLNEELNQELVTLRMAYHNCVAISTTLEESGELEDAKTKDSESVDGDHFALDAELNFKLGKRIDALNATVSELRKENEQLTGDSQAKDARISELNQDVNALLTELSQMYGELDELFAFYKAHGDCLLKDQMKSSGELSAEGKSEGGVHLSAVSHLSALSGPMPLIAQRTMRRQQSDQSPMSTWPMPLLEEFITRRTMSATSEEPMAAVCQTTKCHSTLTSLPFTDAGAEHWSAAHCGHSKLALSCESMHKLKRLESAVSSKKLQRNDTFAALALLKQSDLDTATELQPLSVLESGSEEQTEDGREEVVEIKGTKDVAMVESLLTLSPKKQTAADGFEVHIHTDETKGNVVISVKPIDKKKMELELVKDLKLQLQCYERKVTALSAQNEDLICDKLVLLKTASKAMESMRADFRILSHITK